MSFDLFLVAFRGGAAGTADAVAARRVLDGFRYRPEPERDGYYDVSFSDGSHVELYADGLSGGEKPFDGGMFVLRSITSAGADFIFEFAQAAGCAIFPAMNPNCVLVPRHDLTAELPESVVKDFPLIPVVSGAELLAVIQGGLDAWRAYRDRVVRGSDGQSMGAC